jgi:P-type Cu2+ transporter
MLTMLASALLSPPGASTPPHAEGRCVHCGTPLPPSPIVDAQGRGFCCGGCSTVFTAIQSAGLGAFYDNRDLALGAPRPGRPSGGEFAGLDDTASTDRFRSHADGTRSTDLALEGLHCAACVWLVESLPRAVPGVLEARLDFARSLLMVRWDPQKTTLGAAARELDRWGYTPHPARTAEAMAGVDRGLLMRLGVAGAVAGNVMLMALALYSGAGSRVDTDYSTFFRYGSLALSLPSVLYCAEPFLRGAWASVRARIPSMDLPITIGIVAGFASGAVNTFRGEGETYFDTISTLIFLLLVGRWLGQKQKRRAATATDFAQALAPATARTANGTEWREVRADAVPTGALVEVRKGERIPVDGRIELGECLLDTRLLTGESSPSEAKIGDRVYAGTENVGATIVVRTERSGSSTRVAELLRAMEDAQRGRAPIVRIADRVSAIFVVLVLVLAVLTLALWWHVDPALAVDHAVALLVVTCPCALGMATPLAVSVSLARAARRGILVKSGEVLEALARPADLVFDKSGTLTAGRPELLEFSGPSELAERVSAAEEGADHPLARAFRRAFGPSSLAAGGSERLPGAGVRAKVAGHDLLIGTAELLRASDIPIDARTDELVRRHAEQACTPVLVAEDGRVAGVAAFGDALRPDTLGTLEELAGLSRSIDVLSGDHPLVVERVCRSLPIRAFRGGVSPEEKLADVQARIARGERVVMVGDGVNDAAAMSAATVGFAVHGGAEASLLAASVFATEPGVRPVLETIRGARLTLRAIHRGLAFSLAYNAVGVALAMSGVLSPLLAAVMMPLSSLTVLTSALRSRAFVTPPEERERPLRA